MMKAPQISPQVPDDDARSPGARAWRALERGADRICGAGDNPLRQLGALGFLLFWLIAASGIYLYIFFDTDLAGAHASIERLTHGQWWAGGVMRSLHRYASDAFVVVIGLHLVRELLLGRFYGFRWFSWVSGVPTLWLAAASGVIGYWLVWDEVAQFVGIAVTEWFGALPGFGPALVRNFIADEAMTDRMFSLLVFLHIGVPLALLLAMWIHVQRLTRPATMATRALTAWAFASLLALSLAWPALSQPPADLARVPLRVPIDWFYLAPLAAIYEATSLVVWAVVLGATLLLAAAPWLVRVPRPAAAKVDPDNCNGCTRCFADCPYSAIVMAPHPSGRGQIAVVSDDFCAGCGICAGACPTATPFRSGDRLGTGIDLPSLPVEALRAELARKLEAAGGESPGTAGATPTARPIVVFACAEGAIPSSASDLITIDLVCAGMLPPSFIDYALRRGAAGVVIASCPPDDCGYRFGARWTAERVRGEREPRLRAGVERDHVEVVFASREDQGVLGASLERMRESLAVRAASLRAMSRAESASAGI